jgi:hypothetical protein
MCKKKQTKRNFKLFCPEASTDIEDIVGILLESETSILVNMSKHNLKKADISKIINFIISCQTSYMVIRVKKIYSKVFVCWSEQPKLYF